MEREAARKGAHLAALMLESLIKFKYRLSKVEEWWENFPVGRTSPFLFFTRNYSDHTHTCAHAQMHTHSPSHWSMGGLRPFLWSCSAQPRSDCEMTHRATTKSTEEVDPSPGFSWGLSTQGTGPGPTASKHLGTC